MVNITEIEVLSKSGVSQGVMGVLFDAGFYVNGVKTDPVGGVVNLDAPGKYVLSGVLLGRIEVGAPTDEPTDDTFITLDGLKLMNEDPLNTGIHYLPESKSMVVTLAKNKNNLILCNKSAEMTDSQLGCIHSENNMTIQGNGYLSLINNGGHGMKASQLIITGRPHLYVEAIHDGIHGNKSLVVDDGFFYINKANDAFGTRAESGTPGSDSYKAPGYIHIFGGKFHCFNIRQQVFDSKAPGTIFSNIEVSTDAETPYSGMTELDTANFFGTGKVMDGAVEVTPADGVYSCSSTSVTVEGYIQGQIKLNTNSTDVSLNGAYIECASGHAIYYAKTGKKVQVTAEKKTINIVRQTGTEGDAIKSDNNIVIECKNDSHLLVSSANGSGINGSEVTVKDSKGVLMVTDCKVYGIQGTDIYFACCADMYDASKAASVDLTKQPIYGAVIAFRNETADIHARLSGSGAKGWITIEDLYLHGVICVEKLSVSTLGKLNKAANLFYNSVNGKLSGDKGKTYEPYNAIPYGEFSIPLG